MKFKAVFFDLDGTLANSLLDLSASVNYCLKQNNFPLHSCESYKLFVGDGIAKMIERALPKDKATPENIEKVKAEFMLYYGEHYADNTVSYEGIDNLILKLKQNNIKIAVVTNKAQIMAEKLVTKLFGDSFDYVLGMRPDIPAKPDPTGVLMAMRELDVKPNEVAFIGDTGMDITAGVNAGAFPIGVLWGFREKSEMQSCGAQKFAHSADELAELLGV